MTTEEAVRPSTKLDIRTGKAVVDVRTDAARIPNPDPSKEDLVNARVIHFDQSPNWLANNKMGGFPDKVVLTDDYRAGLGHPKSGLGQRRWSRSGRGRNQNRGVEVMSTDRLWEGQRCLSSRTWPTYWITSMRY